MGIKKLLSKRGQLSLEFTLLMLAVVTAAVVVGYHMIKTSLHVKNASIEMINTTSSATLQVLSKV
ncbi:MAG TPA: class III signal peptide-containing protein [Methanothermococcus okinawensis]|uniref:Class III signal peptide-containing protein n=1 Tax=Methanothermococcus okinawensis TaxID=155863 RepID=A0A832ZZ37_9EURY|nr:class III signal peptide-containing protein [Methanothermococcus okinawensis]